MQNHPDRLVYKLAVSRAARIDTQNGGSARTSHRTQQGVCIDGGSVVARLIKRIFGCGSAISRFTIPALDDGHLPVGSFLGSASAAFSYRHSKPYNRVFLMINRRDARGTLHRSRPCQPNTAFFSSPTKARHSSREYPLMTRPCSSSSSACSFPSQSVAALMIKFFPPQSSGGVVKIQG